MVSTREDPTPAGVVSHPSRAAPRVLALLLTACLLLPLGLPALSGSSVPVLPGEGDRDGSSGSPSSDWPPPAWHQGDMSDLSLVELALLASDSRPSPENRAELERGLAPLEDMPPEHTELTRVVLEGLAQARWHQVQAMRHLNEEQRAIVAQADPDAPLPAGWGDVMGAVDHQELAKALLALEASSARALAIFESLHGAPPAPGVAETLADATGAPLPETLPVLPVEVPSADLTAALVAQVTDLALEPAELVYLKESLNGMPPEARSAVHLILEGLVPFAAGAPADPGAALVELGGAVDAARDTLELWSTAAMAQQLFHVATGPGIEIPDADTDRPPLHFGVPRLRDPGAPLPPAPSLPEALRELALAFGDHETARDAEEKARPVMEVLPQSQQDAVAQMLAQAARYIRAQEAAGEASVPGALVQNPGLLTAWVGYLDEGLPEPGSLEARDLLAARGYLQAQLEAVLSREDLMTAIQDAVEELTPEAQPSSASSSPLPDAPTLPAPMMPMSGPFQEAGIDCPLDEEVIGVAPYFLIEPCGEDTVWTQEDLSVFVIDVGGNDTYEGPFAGAPFNFEIPGPGNVPDSNVDSPLAVLLDLGGSDFYNATGHDCALGAGCGSGATGILVDWEGDGAVSENRFVSGNQSQGYALGAGSTGVLVERVGAGSNLTSVYEAMDLGQGVADGGLHSGVGALLRLSGRESNTTATFIAGDWSQGANALTGTGNLNVNPGIGAFLNIAGPGARAPDHYVAGEFAQGATAVDSVDLGVVAGVAGYGAGLFADIVGSGGQSDDVYEAVDNVRGYGAGGYFFDLLLPESVEQKGLVEQSASLEVPEVASPEELDPDDPRLPGMPGVDPEDGTRPALAAHVASTGNRSSSNDTFILSGVGNPAAHGSGPVMIEGVGGDWFYQTLYLNLGGNNTYPGEPECSTDEFTGIAVSPANECMWQQPGPVSQVPSPTGIDTSALRDEDGNFFPYFLEELLGVSDPDDDPDQPHPTGRRVVVDLGARYPYLNDTYAFVLSIVGDTVYGTGFSSAVLMDLGGDNEHLGRTAAAIAPSVGGSLEPDDVDGTLDHPEAAQNLLSFTLDLDGDDVYHSPVNGSIGFGAGGASGILFDLGGNDDYHGASFTQGAATGGGVGVLVDLKTRISGDLSTEEVNRFRADGNRSQGYGEDGGVGLLVADGDHNEFHDGGTGEDVPTLWQLSDAAWDQLEAAADAGDIPGPVRTAIQQIRQATQDLRGDENLQPAFEIINEFLDEHYPEHVEADTGIRQEGTGISVNLAGDPDPNAEEEDGRYHVRAREEANVGPVIVEWGVQGNGVEWTNTSDEMFPELQAGRTYTFNAIAVDEDGDRIRFCWTFNERVCEWPEGGGTVESRVDFQWTEVPTDAAATEESLRERMLFDVDLEVNDAGGKGDRSGLVPIPVVNPPLEVKGDLRGPRFVETGQSAAFQLPFVSDDRHDLPGLEDDAVEVDWGDGVERFNAIAVNWAASSNGGRVQLQSGVPEGFDRAAQVERARPLGNAVDGDRETYTRIFQDPADQQRDAPATVVVDFAGPRQIRQIALNASLVQDSGRDVQLALEAIRQDGTTFALDSGTVKLTSSSWDRHERNLTDFPDLRGLMIRQIIPPNEQELFTGSLDAWPTYQFRINEISAQGPGAVKEGGWAQPGQWEVNYAVLDRFQGRNGITQVLQVVGEAQAEPSIGLVDFADRGPVRQATVAFNATYDFVFDVQDLLRGEEFCVDVELDGGETDRSCYGNGSDQEVSFFWNDPGSYDVTATLYRDGVAAGDPSIHLATVHVEAAIDLRLDDGDSPVLFMTFEPDRDGWYEGVQYQAIVDAGGDDRYFGPVAASIPDPIEGPSLGSDGDGDPQTVVGFAGVPVPRLSLNAGGNDLYASYMARTQAFATHFGVALLMDAGGDDTYVAAGEAQAAATRGGVAALVSLGGRDRFNPLPADHAAVAGASARMTAPTDHDVFRGGRAVGTGPDLVQGAAEDGVALFVTAGGPLGGAGLFHAGSRAQGYGSHEVPSVDHYAYPGVGEGCDDIWQGNPFDEGGVDAIQALCLLGITSVPDPVQNPGYYTMVQPDPSQDSVPTGGSFIRGTPLEAEEDQETLLCEDVPNFGPPATYGICEQSQPDTRVLAAFLTDGPRYGPGLGAMVRLDGPAFYHAGMNSQGMAGPDGRGLLLDMDGASGLTAHGRGQAFSASGLAGAVLGGASVLRLGEDGQAAFQEEDLDEEQVTGQLTGGEEVLTGPEAGLTQGLRAAVLLTVGSRDHRCEDRCGPNDERAIDVDMPERPGLPVVEVGGITEPVFTDDPVEVEVSVDMEVNDFSWEQGFEVAAFGVVFPSRDGDGDCTGRPLAAPALVHEGHVDGAFTVALDPGRLVAGTDPLLPAGCTEVHVFAKPAADLDEAGGVPVPVAGWGHGTGSVLLLPPPRIPVDEAPVVSHGEEVGIDVAVQEPLVAFAVGEGNPPGVEFRAVNETGHSELTGFGDPIWVDGGLTFNWDPEDYPDGAYRLQMRLQWDDQYDFEEWDWVTVSLLDLEWLDPGGVSLDEAFTDNPFPVSRGQPVRLHGETSGLLGLEFRLWDDEGSGAVQDMAPWSGDQCLIGTQDLVDNVGATILGDVTAEQAWNVSFCFPGTVVSGEEFVVQYRTTPDEGDGWQDLMDVTGELQQRVFLAGDPPRNVTVTTPGGGHGGSTAPGNAVDPVEICVTMEHNGVGVADEEVLVAVIAWDDAFNVTHFSVERAPGLDPGSGGACRAPASDHHEVFGYTWYDPALPQGEALAEGDYEVYVFARDRVGGIFDHNPGFWFPIDRTDPVLSNADWELPPMTRPDMETVPQEAVKPGDLVDVFVRVRDVNLKQVSAFIELDDGARWEAELDTVGEDGRHTGAITVPANPALDDDGRLMVRAHAVDRANNSDTLDVTVGPLGATDGVPFHAHGFGFAKTPHGDDNITIEERSRSVEIRWVLNRSLEGAGDGMRAILQDATGLDNLSVQKAHPVMGQQNTYRVFFQEGLQPDTPYQVVLQMWDGANFTLLPEDPLPVRTLGLPFGSALELTTDDVPTYSGEVRVEGQLVAGIAGITGDLSLFVDDPGEESRVPARLEVDGTPVGPGAQETHIFTVEGGERGDFALVWDSRDRVPVDADVDAEEVTLHVAFTDGSVTLTDSITLRIDNTPPRLELDVFGPEPNQGWYNGTIVAGVDVTDDTPPFSHLVEVEGVTDGPLGQKTLRLDEDGIYEVTFTVSDGAIPPNVAQLEATLKVDRTLPSLNVTSGLADPWTNETRVPFVTQAEDSISGLDGFRVRAGGLPWSPWSAVVPDEASLEGLPDGEHWVEVEVRDTARNVRQESFSVILDRTPPELVDARWVGWTQQAEPRPVLHVVARDVVEGEGVPSGIAAVRFAPTSDGPWTNWTHLGTSGTFAINETHAGVVWVQLRDRATNAAEPVRVEKPLPGRHETVTDPEDALADVPASALVRDAAFAPEDGSPDTPFTFSVRVHPLGGALPDRVVLSVADQVHDMEPEGPVLEGGARFYTATVTLPPTDYASPHAYTIGAKYGDRFVESAAQPGPTVLKLGAEPVAAQQEDDARGFPIPAVPALLIVLVLAALLIFKRRIPFSRLDSWRRKP